jgi:guanylate kinase
MENRKGMLLVVSGASGTGKGTLLERLLKDDPSCAFSVSVTTREPRENEIPDVHYHFISDEEYDKLLEEDAFLEHADVHTARYGTLKSEVFDRMERGQNVVLDIDVQGALQVMERCPECVSLFILPPSFTELRRRLEGRGTETQEKIEIRLRNAREEVKLVNRYQYVIVNDDLDTAVAQLECIVNAEKLRTTRWCPALEEA